MTMRSQDQQSRALYEISDLVLNILRYPPSTFHHSTPSPSRRPLNLPQITPLESVMLLLGVSMSLMLCGSVTFFLGFFLMPWVIGLVVVLYFVGIISSLTMLGRAILSSTNSSSSPSPKEIPPWKIM